MDLVQQKTRKSCVSHLHFYPIDKLNGDSPDLWTIRRAVRCWFGKEANLKRAALNNCSHRRNRGAQARAIQVFQASSTTGSWQGEQRNTSWSRSAFSNSTEITAAVRTARKTIQAVAPSPSSISFLEASGIEGNWIMGPSFCVDTDCRCRSRSRGTCRGRCRATCWSQSWRCSWNVSGAGRWDSSRSTCGRKASWWS